VEDATRHAEDAISANTQAGALFAARRVAQRIAASTPTARFERAGEVWNLEWRGVQTTMRDRKGLRDLAQLLATPGREIAALDLAGGYVVDAGGGQTLDASARDAYLARLRGIENELDDADRRGDRTRSALLAGERDALIGELTTAFGLGGRARKLGPSPAERARSTVTQRIRDAIRHVRDVDGALADHLERTVRTGTFCVYQPDETVRWQL
jgi:hypothetical protein